MCELSHTSITLINIHQTVEYRLDNVVVGTYIKCRYKHRPSGFIERDRY